MLLGEMGRKKNKQEDNVQNIEQPQQPPQNHQHYQSDNEIPAITLTYGYAYISVKGAYINEIGRRNYGVPHHYVQNRWTRDGSDHSHLTLIPPQELKVALANAGITLPKKRQSRAIKALIQWITERVGDPATWNPNDWPVDLGLAFSNKQEKVVQEHEGRGGGASSVSKRIISSKAYYRVMHWPFGERIRQLLQLKPAFFHVTVGFDPTDVHGVYKGPGTLLSLDTSSSLLYYHHTATQYGIDEEQVLVNELANLVKVACHYIKDILFLDALANRCLCYREQLDACAVNWKFILQYSSSLQLSEGDELCMYLCFIMVLTTFVKDDMHDN
ncbi:hypothetical protein BDB00DRAFT_333205 [Zychaea mexicana]|uniref:uncharacterized protein n=1 Tax=Zychaea mexicana TaxID=64656 RepID=UPI0022FF4529|nr:uncharacterized protein BDB00DRAFT_333205 [Zychaea mexicana]KAI9499076.1 hypothetical protein BDB00DRAFT_333205 [Zychaea mexicana]